MLFVALGFTAFFIIKTMYPMGLLTNDQTTTTITEVDSGNQMAGDAISGDQISGEISNDTLLAAQTGDTSTTGHSSADDMFTDLSSALGSGDQTAVWLNQLTNYSQQGKQYFDQGKATNNKTMMKFGGYIWKKSDTFVNALESGVDLSNAMIPNYLAQFSGYLAQLQALENNALSTPTDIPTTDTQAQDNSLAPTE